MKNRFMNLAILLIGGFLMLGQMACQDPLMEDLKVDDENTVLEGVYLQFQVDADHICVPPNALSDVVIGKKVEGGVNTVLPYEADADHLCIPVLTKKEIVVGKKVPCDVCQGPENNKGSLTVKGKQLCPLHITCEEVKLD